MRILLSFVIVLLFISFRCFDNKNNYDYKHLFDMLLQPAPDTLNLEYLKCYPKFRCIFHDGFDRLDTIRMDDASREHNTSYSIANDTTFGKNSFSYSNEYAYQELSLGRKFIVGVKQKSLACNNVEKNNDGKILKLYDAQRHNYGFMVARSDKNDADAKVAFRVVDANNFYYGRITNRDISLWQIQSGKTKKIFHHNVSDSKCLYGLIDGDSLYLYTDYRYAGKIIINMFSGSTLCGLLFFGNEKSEIDDFEINYLDTLVDNCLDNEIEKGQLNKKNIKKIEAEANLINVSQKHTKHSNYSLRYQLDYYEDWESHKIANMRRSEIVPITKFHSPMDSWISSFDIYFPGVNDGKEYYSSDYLDELFWQQHAPSNVGPLSPNVALYLQNDTITFQALSRSTLLYGRIDFKSNRDYGFDGKIAVLVNSYTDDCQLRQLRKGEWHNFTIYIKEGYSPNHLPRSIVYLDGKKVIDWFIPNMQNSAEKSTYLKIGLYKWPWARYQKRVDVRQRVLYYDNFLYLR